jgi:hypothetical protein
LLTFTVGTGSFDTDVVVCGLRVNPIALPWSVLTDVAMAVNAAIVGVEVGSCSVALGVSMTMFVTLILDPEDSAEIQETTQYVMSG